MSEENIFLMVLDALGPVIGEVIDFLVFPLDAVIAFIWGGIEEILREVIFG